MLDEESLNYIKIARDDIQASEILFQKKLFPQSIFMLAQGTEKLAKVFYHSICLVDYSEMKREIGHEVLEKLPQKLSSLLHLAQDFSSTNEDEAKSKIKEFFKIKYPDKEVSDEEIETVRPFITPFSQMLQGSDEKIKGFEQLIQNMEKLSWSDTLNNENVIKCNLLSFDPVFNIITPMIELFSRMPKSNEPIEGVNFYENLVRGFVGVQFLNVITLLFSLLRPHLIRTRYIESDSSPLEYTEDKALLKNYDEIKKRILLLFESSEKL